MNAFNILVGDLEKTLRYCEWQMVNLFARVTKTSAHSHFYKPNDGTCGCIRWTMVYAVQELLAPRAIRVSVAVFPHSLILRQLGRRDDFHFCSSINN
jgi:hypothetical protein